MKYMGSKARLSKDIAPIINKIIQANNIKTYIEPFIGGSNMIEHIKCEIKIGIDNNEYLIAMWKALQQGWVPPEEMSFNTYKEIKNNKEKYPKELVAIAGFVATYNAKWFGGYAGIVNTKIGTIRNYYDEARRNILRQIPKLLDVKFIYDDYKNLKDVRNALIYCDPPYESTTKYKDDFNHTEYWNWCRNIAKNNILLASEYNAPEDFTCIFTKELTTTLDKNSRKKDVEKLFIYNN